MRSLFVQWNSTLSTVVECTKRTFKVDENEEHDEDEGSGGSGRQGSTIPPPPPSA
jgi:hypothetical protein